MQISHRKRLIVYSRDYFKCKNCSRSPAIDCKIKLNIDHIIPIVKGGKDHIDNLQTLCSHCNTLKNDGTQKDLEHRLFREKYKMKYISYPKQTAEDRENRLYKLQCIIHASPLNNKKCKDKSIYKCNYKNCDFYLIKKGDSFWFPKKFDHLMIGKFSLIL